MPVEPTREMLDAYNGALKQNIEAEPHPEIKWKPRKTFRGFPGGYKIPPDVKAVWRWRAMLSALPPEPPVEAGED